MRRSIALYMALVFLSGVVVGVLGDRLVTNDTVRAKSRKDWTPEEWRRHYVEMMQTELSLTTEQLATLNQILDHSRDRYVALDEEVIHPQKHAIREEQTAAVEDMLTGEQLVKYRELKAERAERRRKQREEEEKKNRSSSSK